MRSCHRVHVDTFLDGARPRMRGYVLDIGGTRVNKKGEFRPPTDGVTQWQYLNINPAAQPDLLCDAEQIPLADNTVDCFLLCEVLEHVERPEVVLTEAARVLRPGGHAVVTLPFLYPVHADPFDYQRWTADKLRREIKLAGLEPVEIVPLGGPLSALHDTLLNLTWRSGNSKSFSMRALAKVLTWTVGVTLRSDRKFETAAQHITSGWGCIAVKRPPPDLLELPRHET
jgi:SAM-dependent methyltransferase